MSQLRIGLIGSGNIAVSAHVPALLRLTSIARVVSVCDVRAEVAQRVAGTFGAAWTQDYHEILNDPAVDAVVITTPEFLHAEQTIAAAEAGKHVLCEKPMSSTVAEADAMLAAADRAGIHFMIAHSRRFTSRYLTIRRILDSGAIGEPVMIRENERRPQAFAAALTDQVGQWRPGGEGTPLWREMARFAGGVSRGTGIHEIDLFRWFAGSEARSVFMETKITIQGREVPDYASFQITFQNGVLAASNLNSESPPGYPYYHQTEIFGTEGVLRARDADQIAVTRYGAGGMRFPTSLQSLVYVGDAYVTEHRLFYESILKGTPVPLDPRNGRMAMEIAVAASHSAQTGRPVELPFVEQ